MAQGRIWTDGTSEPSSWTLASTDPSTLTPTNLRGSGSTGVYFDAKNSVNATYDDLVIRPIDTSAPTTPTNLSGSSPSANRIDLTWTASTDNLVVAGYNVYREGTKVNSAPVGSTSYTDAWLTAGTAHTYSVKAVDAAGNESVVASNTWTGSAVSGGLVTSYTYDAENRLTQRQTGGQTLGTYAYDGAGDRVAKTTAACTTAYPRSRELAAADHRRDRGFEYDHLRQRRLTSRNRPNGHHLPAPTCPPWKPRAETSPRCWVTRRCEEIDRNQRSDRRTLQGDLGQGIARQRNPKRLALRRFPAVQPQDGGSVT